MLLCLVIRATKEMRCIIFVERVITAITLQFLLSEVLASNDWTVTYMAGNNSGLNLQRRNEHIKIIDSFRKGAVCLKSSGLSVIIIQ